MPRGRKPKNMEENVVGEVNENTTNPAVNDNSRYVTVKLAVLVNDENKDSFDKLMMDAFCMDSVYGIEVSYKSIKDPYIQNIINGTPIPNNYYRR